MGVLIQGVPHVLVMQRLELLVERRELSPEVIDVGASGTRDDAVQRCDMLPQLAQHLAVGARLRHELPVECVGHVGTSQLAHVVPRPIADPACGPARQSMSALLLALGQRPRNSVVAVAGGVTGNHVLYNFTGSGATLSTHVGNVIIGTLLAAHDSFNLDGAFVGEIIGGGNSISLLSDATVSGSGVVSNTASVSMSATNPTRSDDTSPAVISVH